MSTFEEVRFPISISTNSSGGPEFSTDVVVVNDGYERRNQNWSQGRISYDASYGVRSMADIATVLKFFRARQGKAIGFRFQDPLDHTSASDGLSGYYMTDQSIGTGNGETTAFQLVKNYTNGITTHVRKITKPVAGKLAVAVAGVLTTDYTIDTTTGIITFTTAPIAEAVITAGFEFDIPVRFDSDDLDVKLAYVKNAQFSVPVIEVRV